MNGGGHGDGDGEREVQPHVAAFKLLRLLLPHLSPCPRQGHQAVWAGPMCSSFEDPVGSLGLGHTQICSADNLHYLRHGPLRTLLSFTQLWLLRVRGAHSIWGALCLENCPEPTLPNSFPIVVSSLLLGVHVTHWWSPKPYLGTILPAKRLACIFQTGLTV